MSVAKNLLLTFLLSFYCTTVFAEPDVVKGRELANEWCTHCHNVESAGPFKQHPPSFASIALYRSKEQIYGRIVFPPLHASMPQIGYMLTPDNVEDLVAFIVSLESL